MDLLIHCDTSGAWRFKLPPNDPAQPHILRLSAMLRGAPFDRIISTIVRLPDGALIEEGAYRAHGIDEAAMLADGRPLADVLGQFDQMAAKAGRILGYGLDFHLAVLDRAYSQAVGHPFIAPAARVDLMREATPIVKVPRMQPGGGFAFPKLAVAYEHFASKPFERSDDPLQAGVDTVRALATIMDGIEAASAAAV